MLRNFILFLALSVFFLACNSSEVKNPGGKQQYIIPDSLLKSLVIDTVSVCPWVDAFTFTGQVDFNQDNQVNIYPLVSGNVEDVKVQLGDYVRSGQVLAIVKSSEMAAYSNNLTTAETNLEVAKKNLDAEKDLFKSGLASQLEVTSAQANYDQAIAQLEMIKRVLNINGSNTQGDYIIKAPISGFVVQKNVTNNTVIRSDNGNNVFTISDLKNIWIWANVYESNISAIHIGSNVEVTTISYPGRIFTGKVDKIMNVLDPANKVMKVRITLPNPGYALKPQMFANITVTNNEDREALCISSSALIFDHSQYFVITYNSRSDVQITQVNVINTVGNKTYISEGVHRGDKIIASQAQMIYDALNS